MNRRLIRPTLSEVKTRGANDRGRKGGKQVPADATSAEAYYYVKQMQARTPVVVVLQDQETVRGWIEWYDQNCIKVHRDTGPNLLIYKSAIKYLYKDEDADSDTGGSDETDETQEIPETEAVEVAHARHPG